MSIACAAALRYHGPLPALIFANLSTPRGIAEAFEEVVRRNTLRYAPLRSTKEKGGRFRCRSEMRSSLEHAVIDVREDRVA